MPGVTPGGLPYPIGTDRVMDGDNAIQDLAETVDTKIMTYALMYKGVNGTLPGTGNLWFSDLTLSRKQGNIGNDSTGVIINVAGDYEMIGMVRASVTTGTNVIHACHIGQNSGSVPLGVATVVLPRATDNWTATAHAVAPLAVGDHVNLGYFQATTSTISVLGSANCTNLFVRLLK